MICKKHVAATLAALCGLGLVAGAGSALASGGSSLKAIWAKSS